MTEFLEKLGIDGRLLLSQAVNFLLLLVVFRIFAYKPILKVLKDRRERIEEGLAKAKEAGERLDQVNLIAKNKIKEAEQQALGIIKNTEDEAKKVEAKLLEQARQKEAELLKSAELAAAHKQQEARRLMEQEAAQLVKQGLIKTVELDPEQIDEALIRKAIEAVKNPH